MCALTVQIHIGKRHNKAAFIARVEVEKKERRVNKQSPPALSIESNRFSYMKFIVNALSLSLYATLSISRSPFSHSIFMTRIAACKYELLRAIIHENK